MAHGEIVDGPGVPGSPGGDKDEACAQAGVAKIKNQLPQWALTVRATAVEIRHVTRELRFALVRDKPWRRCWFVLRSAMQRPSRNDVYIQRVGRIPPAEGTTSTDARSAHPPLRRRGKHPQKEFRNKRELIVFIDSQGSNVTPTVNLFALNVGARQPSQRVCDAGFRRVLLRRPSGDGPVVREARGGQAERGAAS